MAKTQPYTRIVPPDAGPVTRAALSDIYDKLSIVASARVNTQENLDAYKEYIASIPTVTPIGSAAVGGSNAPETLDGSTGRAANPQYAYLPQVSPLPSNNPTQGQPYAQDRLAVILSTETGLPGTIWVYSRPDLTWVGPMLGAILYDTHANRANYNATDYPKILYYESDRLALYVSDGVNWMFVSGRSTGTLANIPVDLTTTDSGFTYLITTGTAGVAYNHTLRWTGTIWEAADRLGGFFADYAKVPTEPGWQLCNGASTTYLDVVAGVPTEVAITVPDLRGGIYRKGASAYTGTPNAQTPPTITGGTVGNEASHTHSVTVVSSSTSAPDSTTAFPLSQGTGLIYGSEFDNAAWTKGAGMSITADATTDPEGTGTADLLSTSGDLYLYQDMVIAGTTTGRYYTFSVWLKYYNSLSAITLSLREYSGVTAVQTVTKSVDVDSGGGWLKFSLQIKLIGATSTSLRAYISASGYAHGVYGWGALLDQAQIETLNYAGSAHVHGNNAGQTVSSGPGSSHTHSFSGVTATTSGQPANLDILPYFRR